MSSIEYSITSALNEVWGWLSSLVNPVENSLGTLGTWLFSGIKWLADQIYNAISYIANKIHDAWVWFANKIHDSYTYLAQWISGGLQWIGSGLSWIGQHIYAFGQWLWNGILWIARTLANALETFINWVWRHIVNIWNTIAGYINAFLSSMNDHINNWIEESRDKFVKIVAVNIGIETLYKGLENLHKGNWKFGLLELLFAPIFGQLSASIIDGIVPRPHTTRVLVFPEINIPTIGYEPITIQKPPIPSKPAPSEIPKQPIIASSVGYVPKVSKFNYILSNYSIKVISPYGAVRGFGNSVISDYVTKLIPPVSVYKDGSVRSDINISFKNSLTLHKFNEATSGYLTHLGEMIVKKLGNNVISLNEIKAYFPVAEGISDVASSNYVCMVSVPVDKSYSNDLSGGYSAKIVSPYTSTSYGTASSGYTTSVKKPTEIYQSSEISSMAYYYVTKGSAEVVIYESFEE